MTILVVGATGATGQRLVSQLLERNERVRAVVRAPESLPAALRGHSSLELVHASLLDLDEAALQRTVAGCSAIASCLGHRMNFKGIYGPPRRLVTDATRRLCHAVQASAPQQPIRFVLMNTAAVRDRAREKPFSLAERGLFGVIRALLPPHADNEDAAAWLHANITQGHGMIEWAIVRPDSLIEEDDVTDYRIHPSPVRSPLFDAGKTSRINVARFMAELATQDDAWQAWRWNMPVIYNPGFS
ncbi:MAG: NAD(P)H-binding protein [Xanthomonadaceae bacterium]|nr:NAD(P)H-binding protein [Xanthomonadaceae bacterium]